MNDFRTRLKNRSLVFGGWTSLGHASVTDMLSQSGVDFIGIDLEHSTISLEQAQAIIAHTQAAGLISLPRISSHNPEQIKRLLDAGADGLIVPMVNTKAEAEKVVEWSKYSPLGKRSFGISRAQGYGKDFDAYTSAWNERSALIVQIESIEAVRNIDDILLVKEIDGVMVGPYDMSGSLGIPGQLFHPDIKAACAKVIEACRRHNKACGTQVVDPTQQNVADALKEGYSFVVLSSDVFLLWKWGERTKELVNHVRKTAPAAR